jgi:hypothetical protein
LFSADVSHEPLQQGMEVGKSKLELKIKSGEVESKLHKILPLIFKERYSPQRPYLFIKAKAQPGKASLLKDAIKTFAQKSIEFALSVACYEKLEFTKQLNIKVLEKEDQVMVLFDFGTTPQTNEIGQMVHKYMDVLKIVQPTFRLNLESCMELQDTIPDSNFEIAEDASNFNQSNLLDLLMNGLMINLDLTYSNRVEGHLGKIVMMFSEIAKEKDLKFGFNSDENTNFKFNLKLNTENKTAEELEQSIPKDKERNPKKIKIENLKAKIWEHIRDSNWKLPDGIDLVDEIGFILNEFYFGEDGHIFEAIPFCEEFIHDVMEYALSDNEIGFAIGCLEISLEGRTNGIKKMFEMAFSHFE